jgi:hypothetical protein
MIDKGELLEFVYKKLKGLFSIGLVNFDEETLDIDFRVYGDDIFFPRVDILRRENRSLMDDGGDWENCPFLKYIFGLGEGSVNALSASNPGDIGLLEDMNPLNCGLGNAVTVTLSGVTTIGVFCLVPLVDCSPVFLGISLQSSSNLYLCERRQCAFCFSPLIV